MFDAKNNKYIGYIYKIYNDINDKLYIGQTTTNIEHRWSQHKADAKTSNCVIYYAIRKYGVKNFHISEIDSVTSNNKKDLIIKLNEKEKFYIKKYNTLANQNGYNMTEGGENHSKFHRYPVCAYNRNGDFMYFFDSISEMSRVVNYDKSAIKDCCDGKSVPNIDLIFRYKNDPFDKYSIERRTTSVPIYQFSLDGELLCRYNSITEADKVMGGKGVSNVLNGKNKTYKGYYWSYIDKFDFEPIIDTRIAVDAYTRDGIFIGSYDSIVDGLSNNNIESNCWSAVSKCCKGETPYVLDIVWRYKGDSFDLYSSDNSRWTGVDMYDVYGNLITTFKSMVAASNYLGEENRVANISACCLGKVNTVMGKVFRYTRDPFDKYNVKYTYKDEIRKIKKI